MKTKLTLSLATVATLTLIAGLAGCNTKSKEASWTIASGTAGTVPAHGAAASTARPASTARSFSSGQGLHDVGRTILGEKMPAVSGVATNPDSQSPLDGT